MTKEDLIQEHHMVDKLMSVAKAQHHANLSIQYAEQESISFAEWVAMNGWYFNKISRWSNRSEKSENLIEVISNTKSTSELYQLYKKETQQK